MILKASRCFRSGIHHKAVLRFPFKARLCIELRSIEMTGKSGLFRFILCSFLHCTLLDLIVWSSGWEKSWEWLLSAVVTDVSIDYLFGARHQSQVNSIIGRRGLLVRTHACWTLDSEVRVKVMTGQFLSLIASQSTKGINRCRGIVNLVPRASRLFFQNGSRSGENSWYTED